jgi:hypothetical protein
MTIINRIIFAIRLRRAKHDANRYSYDTGCKCYVIIWKGKPLAITKKHIKSLIARRCFRKGVTVATIEAQALYVTGPSVPSIPPQQRYARKGGGQNDPKPSIIQEIAAKSALCIGHFNEENPQN